MRALAEAYPDGEFVQQVVALLPWGHNVRLLDAVKNSEDRSWYLRQAVQNGWSRNVLMHQIEGGLYQRQGKAITNFTWTLPAPQSELAQQLIKDPYNFDFLTLGPEMDERALERGLIEHVRDFILELGKGFAFIGSQQHLQVGGQDFFMDLLFYHVRLRCYVVIDLKIEEFKPEFAGKMNFYLAAVDEQMRHTGDSPTIGIILCKGRNEVIVEYSLRETNKSMGVAQYQLTHGESLPERLQEELPTVEELMKLLKGKQVASTWAGTPENVNGRMFEVLGLPPGKEALLQARPNGRWKIWYAASGNHRWRGDFTSEEEALESLAFEIGTDPNLNTRPS